MKLVRTYITILLVQFFSSLGWSQALTGTKVIAPSGGDYTSFSAAINALNTNGVGDGGVTFSVAPGTYSEPPLNITTQTGTATRPIRFVKASGTVTINSTSGANNAFALTGASYITIDGIDLNVPYATGTSSGYYLTATAPTGVGSKYNTIQNCTITMSDTLTSTRRAIYSSTNAVTSVNANNSNNSFLYNTIHKCSNGIRLLGPSAAVNYETGNVIAGNVIGGSTDDLLAATNAVGIYIAGQSGCTIRDNTISNVSTTGTSAGNISTSDAFGIRAESFTGTVTIERNSISMIKCYNSTTASQRSAFGIYSYPNTGATVQIFNNMISNITHNQPSDTSTIAASVADNNPGYGCFGIYARAATSNVYHNTVWMNSNIRVSSSAYWNANSAATVRNNIFASTIANQTNAKHYCFCRPAGTITANYNCFYVTNTNGLIGYSGGDKSDSTAWVSIPGNPYGANSRYTAYPLFISSTNLHIQNQSGSPVSNAGANLQSTVGTDIDGNARSTTPDIGADEGDFAAPPGAIQNPNGSQQAWTPTIPNDIALNNTPPLQVTFPAQSGMNQNPSWITISTTTSRPAGLNQGTSPTSNTINRYWTITSSSENFTNATLELRFTSADLPAGITNPLTASPPLTATYSTDGGNTWLTTTGIVTGPVSGVYSFTITGLSHFSQWALGNGGVLPVELSVFRASQNGNRIDLLWRTESELNNHHFVLERWVNSNHNQIEQFNISSRSPNGQSSTPIDYVYHDTYGLQFGRTYSYRLSQVDLDGRTTELRTLSVEMKENTIAIPFGINLLDAYPNPFNPVISIRVQLQSGGQATVAIYNLNGKLVKQLYSGYVGAMTQVLTFNGSSLASGVYLVRISSEDYTAQKKLVLLR